MACSLPKVLIAWYTQIDIHGVFQQLDGLGGIFIVAILSFGPDKDLFNQSAEFERHATFSAELARSPKSLQAIASENPTS